MGFRDNLKLIKFAELTAKQREDLKKTLKERQQEIQVALRAVERDTRRQSSAKKKGGERGRIEAKEPAQNVQWVAAPGSSQTSHSTLSHAMPLTEKMAVLRDQLASLQAQLDEIHRTFADMIRKA